MTPKIIGPEYTAVRWPYVNRMGEPEEEDYYTEKEEQNPKDPLPGSFYKNIKQADTTWMAKQEVFSDQPRS